MIIFYLAFTGFNVETVVYKNLTFTVWDIGGRVTLKRLWRHYHQNAQAVIFVVDCNDVTRMDEAREALFRVARTVCRSYFFSCQITSNDF